MADPVISVGIPIHNGLPDLERTLDACLDDAIDGLEVVVSDNASTDGTSEFVRDRAAADDRIQWEPTDQLLPVLENFRRCVTLSRGTFFRWNGHDDWPGEGMQAACLRTLQDEPTAVSCLVDVQFVDGDGTLGLHHREGVPGADDARGPRRVHGVAWHLRAPSTLLFSLMRREALLQTGLLRDIPEASKVLALELAILGRLPSVNDVTFNRTFSDEHRRRDHWVWLDPERNRGRRPLATPRQVRHQLSAVASAPWSLPQRLAGGVDVFAALATIRTRDKARAISRQFTGRRWEAPV